MKSTEIEISISEQKLFLLDNKSVIKTYLISSSKYGEGSKVNSFKTPLGKHVVKRKNKKNLRKSPGNGSNSGLTSRTPQDILIRKD